MLTWVSSMNLTEEVQACTVARTTEMQGRVAVSVFRRQHGS